MLPEYRSIELNVRIGCPVMCHYCPQDVLLRADHGNQKIMSLETLATVLQNASTPETPIEVFFAGFTEPLSIKHWFDLVRLCDDHPLVTKVVIFTTGYKILPADIAALASLKKLKMMIHVGHKSSMPHFDESLWGKLADIATHLGAITTFLGVAHDRAEFTDIEARLKEHNLNFQFQKIISRAGNLTTLELKTYSYPVTCSKMHEQKRPVILPDGTAVACTNDYGCEMKIGNLCTGTWAELDFQKIIDLQKNPRSGLPCFRDCHYARPDPANFKIFS